MCYHPLVALYVDKDMPLKYIQKSTSESRNNISNLASIYRDLCFRPNAKMIEFPCGKCVACRLSKSLDWTQRVMSEVSDNSYFVTFTYDDQYLPLNKNGIPTLLSINEFSKVLKRMRSYLDYHFPCFYDPEKESFFRFFGCGEYGDTYHRPHYHFIFLNLPKIELSPLFISEQGFQVYRSSTLENVWKNGFVTVSKVSANNVAYVARYTLKKQGKNEYAEADLVQPWVNMSRKPGIGRDFIEKNYNKVYEFDKVNLKFSDKILSLKPSKYYDKFYKNIDDVDLQRIKEVRAELAEASLIDKLNQTDLTLDELRTVEEDSKINAIKLLKRSLD